MPRSRAASAAGDARPLITISVPVLNEERSLPSLLDRLDALAAGEAKYRFEFLFTDNASTDGTFEILAEAAARDPRIRVLRFTRNFGFQRSILVNYLNARGAAAIQIDADLQDPPELATAFLRSWEEGYKVVYGIRRRRPEFFLKRWGRKLFYRVLAWLSESELPVDAGDFRLIDRVVIDELAGLNEHSPYLRGTIAGLGFPQRGIPYDRSARTADRSKFGIRRLAALALDGVTSQSTRPLRLITAFGIVTSVVAFVAAAVYLVLYLFGERGTQGFTTLAVIGLATLGRNALFIGILGEYVGRLFNNSRSLPLAVIERRIEPLGAETDKAGPVRATKDRAAP